MVEQPRRRRLIAAAAAIAVAATAGALLWINRPAPAGGRLRVAVVPGATDRVVVEVLNATTTVGMARAATRRLRTEGLDVVAIGSDDVHNLDSTEILVRRGDPAAGDRVRRALGAGGVRTVPDPGRLVDVTVRLGRDFAVPGGVP